MKTIFNNTLLYLYIIFLKNKKINCLWRIKKFDCKCTVIIFNILEAVICLNSAMKLEEFDTKKSKKKIYSIILINFSKIKKIKWTNKKEVGIISTRIANE